MRRRALAWAHERTDAPARPTGRVGVREVARAAGVSTQTVSRVINDHPGIRAETRQRVLDAMAALDYRVNNAARALGTRRTRTIGILASDASMYGPAVGILALEAAARAAGRWVTAAYADAGERSIRRRGRPAPVRAGRGRHRRRRAARAHAVGARRRGARRCRSSRCTVRMRPALQRDAARIAVEHLVELGHTGIAHLAGPEDWVEARRARRRVRGALAGAGLRRRRGVWRGDWSAASGFAAAAEIARAVRAADGPDGGVRRERPDGARADRRASRRGRRRCRQT